MFRDNTSLRGGGRRSRGTRSGGNRRGSRGGRIRNQLEVFRYDVVVDIGDDLGGIKNVRHDISASSTGCDSLASWETGVGDDVPVAEACDIGRTVHVPEREK